MCSTSADALGSGPRLRYPLGYWNANGAIFGIAVALLALDEPAGALDAPCAGSRSRRCPASCSPSTSPTRAAGCWRSLVAAGCLIALSRDRLWLLATLAIGALGALPAVLAMQARDSLADNVANRPTSTRGSRCCSILLAGIALALALFAALRWLERARGRADRARRRALAQPDAC